MKQKIILIIVALLSSSAALSIDGWKGQKAYEISEISQFKDTLSMVSGSEFTFYPFGKTSSINEFNQIMIECGLIKIESTIVQKEKVFRASYNDGEVKYLKIDRVGSRDVEIVSAWYVTPKLTMKNGIKIGDSKDKVLRIYFRSPRRQKIGQINVLKVTSALNGIWHFYTFDQNTLEKIEIRSDYKIE